MSTFPSYNNYNIILLFIIINIIYMIYYLIIFQGKMTKIEWVGELFLVTVPCLVLFSMFIVKDALRILIFMARLDFILKDQISILVYILIICWILQIIYQYISFNLSLNILEYYR